MSEELSDDAWRNVFKFCDCITLLRLEACCTTFHGISHEPGPWELERLVPDTFSFAVEPPIAPRDVCLCALAARSEHKLRQLVRASQEVPEEDRTADWATPLFALCSRVTPIPMVTVSSMDELCYIVELQSNYSDGGPYENRTVSYVVKGKDGWGKDRLNAIHARNDSLNDPARVPGNLLSRTDPAEGEESGIRLPNATATVWAVHVPSKNVAFLHTAPLEEDEDEDTLEGGMWKTPWEAPDDDLLSALPICAGQYEKWLSGCHLYIGYKIHPKLASVDQPLSKPDSSSRAAPTTRPCRDWRPCWFNLQVFGCYLDGRKDCDKGRMLEAMSSQLLWARPRGAKPWWKHQPDVTDKAIQEAFQRLAMV